MGNKVQRKNIKPWGLVHDALVDIMLCFKMFKTSRDYYNVCYYGTSKHLKKSCQRIINVLDSIDEEEKLERIKNELDAEIRRKEVYPGAFVGRYRRRSGSKRGAKQPARRVPDSSGGTV